MRLRPAVRLRPPNAGPRLPAMILSGLCLAGTAVAEQAPLPEPLTLESVLALVPRDLPTEVLSRQYQETAIRARAYECRAQDRSGASDGAVAGGCGYWHLLTPAQQSRLQVMRRFLDVVEADVAMAREDEAMAVAYVELDRARNREELGQYSKVKRSGLDLEYQAVRTNRSVSQARQRVTRSLLAVAIGRPGQLPSDVEAPVMPDWPEALPAVDDLVAQAVERNPVLADWRGRVDTDVSAAPLAAHLELDLRQAVLELWLSYTTLRARRDADVTREDFRDLSLERSRTLYELEAKADLGDAMTQQTAARLARVETNHRIFLLLATLNALRGLPVLPLTAEEKA